MDFKISDIKEFFRYDPSSAIIKGNGSGQERNRYYSKVSYRYGYAMKMLCVLLALVMLIFIFSGSISYNNFYYLVKDFGIAADYVNSNYQSITYGVGNSQTFAIYHGGLAVASREGISLYTAGGSELFSLTHQYGNPVIEASAKYALLYDIGGKQYSLYNSFSNMKEETLDHSIYGAVIADTGEYAIISSSEEYRSVLRVYDRDGTRYDYNFSSSYIYSLAMSQDGSRIAIVLLDSVEGAFKSELRVYNIGRSEYQSAYTSFSSVPFEIGFFDNGNICAVSKEGINVFGRNLKLEGEYYTQNEVYEYSLSNDGVAITYFDKNDSESQMILFDKRGNIRYNEKIAGKILDVEIYEQYLFLQTPSGFARINTNKQNDRNEIKIVSSDFKMLVRDTKTVLICNSSYARFIKF